MNGTRYLLILFVLFAVAQGRAAAEVLPPVSERFTPSEASEVPDFRRHVVPLLSRLGCNGRACHGSFQGQGGFQLSLFGYDFDADHKSLLDGDPARVNPQEPAQSLILRKPTLLEEHEGGERMKPDSWQYRLLHHWIEAGAKPYETSSPEFSRLEVTPSEIVFKQPGETVQLKVIAHWADGSQEEVTPICRFRSNDESIATVDETGLVTAQEKGDTHAVVFYDNGVTPIPVLLPVTELAGERYPEVPAPSTIDKLVVEKLRKLGVVPSDVCSDAEFLRRVSLDMTGTLPLPAEVEAFLADTSTDKRARKIDELLERPTYAAWWTTLLCDFTGNNSQALNKGMIEGPRASTQWYAWIYKRVQDNTPYDKLVEGIVLSAGRRPDQSYEDYCKMMNAEYLDDTGATFANRETMPHYWMRNNARRPEDMALSFSHAFLGLRLECAQCHKHPFDEWTKQDFDAFTGFFRRVNYGIGPDAQKQYKALQEEFAPKGKPQAELRKQLPVLAKEGKLLPWQEVFIPPARKPNPKAKNRKRANANQPATEATPLGGEEIDLTGYDDARRALVEWIRRDPGRYFARSFVNRVWATYFNVGIINPPDDLNKANPPSNQALLDYLTQGFIEHNYDMKWLHREIANSRTYQLSCQPNDTNRLDVRNFSHAVPRRLPAEVAYNAILQATAGQQELQALRSDPSLLASGPGAGSMARRGNRANYALTVFGKPTRTTNCDCERSTEPSLLQTLYLRNDQEMLGLIDRPEGWLRDLDQSRREADDKAAGRNRGREIANLERRIKQQEEAGKTENVERMKKRLERLKEQLAQAEAEKKAVEAENEAAQAAAAGPVPDEAELVRQAYLRTLSRLPAEHELERAQQYLQDPETKDAGLRDLLWALLNTKEFIVNH